MPDWTPHLRERLTRLKLSGAREADIIEELSQHLDERYEELRSRGTSEVDARPYRGFQLSKATSAVGFTSMRGPKLFMFRKV